MYTNIWAKYLPIIRIVMKRSLVAEQILALNTPDFERAGLSRKSGYKFLLKIKEGKLLHVIIDQPIASSLYSVLNNDPVVKELMSENEFQISLNPKFELTIKHIQRVEAPKAEVEQEELAGK